MCHIIPCIEWPAVPIPYFEPPEISSPSDLGLPDLHFNPDVLGNWKSNFNDIKGKFSRQRAKTRNEGRREGAPQAPPVPPQMPNPDDPGRFPGLRCPASHVVACRTALALLLAGASAHELHLDEALFDLFWRDPAPKEGR
jgi:hypothetical protein